MKSFIFCLLLLATAAQAQQTTTTTPQARETHAPLKVGEEFNTNIQTAHPYNTTGQLGVVFEQEFYNKNSAYIKLYFEDFDLGPEDYVEITSHNTGESVLYGGKGKIVDNDGTMISDFWSMGIFDERITVRLHAASTSDHYGFKITRVAYGYSQAQITAMLSGNKSICSADNKERIACYNGTTMFEKGKAVCRLLINGSSLCTGWLLGSEGHIMTNNHCIGNSTAAQNTDFIFNYQYSSCSGSTTASSNTVATTSTFIKTNSTLDYTLVRLPVNPTATYGYLQLQATAPAVGDRIYIVQHPGGRRKEIAVRTDQGGIAAPSGLNYAAIDQLNTNGARYHADTEGGSSGSPVLDYNTNQVVAIHNTGGCTNGSYGRCDKLITSIGSDMPTNGVGGSGGGGGGGGTTCYANITFSLTTDNYGSETSWTIKNTAGSTVASGSGYANNSTYNPTVSLADGNYTFTINDSYGDGICCSYGNGSYTLRGDGQTIASGGAFGSTASHSFCVQGSSGGGGGSGCNTGNVTNSFESNFDGWSNDSGDDFNWERRSGGTPSSNTGPSSAYSGSYYIYMESSSPNYSTKTAIITSPCQDLSGTSTPTANFRYHMYGASAMGTLRLQVSVNNGAWTTIWSRTGNQGNSWLNASVSLASYRGSNVRLRFNGTTGTTWQGDMAVDYFQITGAESAAVESVSALDQEAQLTVFPNPFNDQLNVETTLEGVQGYRLLNLQGQVIQEGSIRSNKTQLSLFGLAPGVYFITLYNEETQLMQKIIKQ